MASASARRRAPTVEPELDRRSAGTYFPAMDGYRALAALAVLLAHVALLSGIVRTNTAFGPYLARADVGVSVFFLLSGFLLYRPFVAARLAGRPSGSLGGYVRRRALRILPAYWFALTIVAFVLQAPGFESPHIDPRPLPPAAPLRRRPGDRGADPAELDPRHRGGLLRVPAGLGVAARPAGTAPRRARSGSR